jgi:YhcN/YlaJ family sporulation lipoprotein
LKRSNSLLLMFITLLIGLSLITGGCNSAAKKPVQPMPDTTTPSTPMPDTTTPSTPMIPDTTSTAPAYPTEMANKISMEAGKVMGVKKAMVLISEKMIYIGLDLQGNLDKQKSAAVEKSVMDKIKSMEPGYTVMVTSDADIVTRIKNVSMGIAQGKPLTSFKTEIDNISSRLNPQVK